MSLKEWQQARLSRDRRFDGRFFVAVKTTGIFCRNICPANLPKEENIEYVELAAQALQKGFRPCLRCRPDSAPNSYAWLGVETTLARGMSLLRDDPESSLSEIADRLGISDGYFRKLFRQKLGISPKQYQLTEQLLLAKKLLHETNLPVEQVAQSVGFQSARRLQHHLKEALQLTPTQIRKQQKKNQGEKMQLYLSYRPPYCWQQVRDFWALRAIPGTEEVTDNSYARTVKWHGPKHLSCGWFKATIEPEHTRFNVQLSFDNYDNLQAILGNIRRILDLDTDYSVVQQGLLSTGLMPEQLTNGLRIPGVWTLFEAGCRAVLGQQVSVKAAVNKVAQLTEKLGEQAELDDPVQSKLPGRYFPTPQAVADSDLAFLKMPLARKNALKALAQWVAEHEREDEPDAWLDIKGIGPWTVAYAKMRGLSEPDIWLGTDLVIKNQIKQFNLDIDNAAPWRSYLTFQLWDHA